MQTVFFKVLSVFLLVGLLANGTVVSAASLTDLESALTPVLEEAGFIPEDYSLIISVIADNLTATGTDVASLTTEAAVPLFRAELEAMTDPVEALPPGTVECFDYYVFDSVRTQLTPDVLTSVPGATINFRGNIFNQNEYPIVDGALYVKVFYERNDDATQTQGPDVVDQFLVEDNLNLQGNGMEPVSFSWEVPAYARSGDYQIATFFTSADRYNLSGLSFTDDIVGDLAEFSVSSPEPELGAVVFDKDAVYIDGEQHQFAAFPLRASSSGPVTITAALENTTESSVTVPVEWSIYYWDAQQQENLLTKKMSEATLAAGESGTVVVEVTDEQYPVYLVEGRALWQDTQSVINVRFAREGVVTSRINFPGVTKYPLKAGEQNELFSCLHAVSSGEDVDNGELELVLRDSDGKQIHRYGYSGVVTGAMMGVTEAFSPSEDYYSFTLDATLKQDGEIVEEVTMAYRCEDLAEDETVCADDEVVSAESKETSSNNLKLLGFLLVVLVGIVGLTVVWLRRHHKETGPSDYEVE